MTSIKLSKVWGIFYQPCHKILIKTIRKNILVFVAFEGRRSEYNTIYLLGSKVAYGNGPYTTAVTYFDQKRHISILIFNLIGFEPNDRVEMTSMCFD